MMATPVVSFTGYVLPSALRRLRLHVQHVAEWQNAETTWPPSRQAIESRQGASPTGPSLNQVDLTTIGTAITPQGQPPRGVHGAALGPMRPSSPARRWSGATALPKVPSRPNDKLARSNQAAGRPPKRVDRHPGHLPQPVPS